MSLTTQTTSIPEFSGQPRDFISWQNSVFYAAAAFPSGGPHGLIPFIMDPVEELAFTNSGTTYVAFTDPGPAPTIAATASAPARALFNAQFTVWDKQFQYYSKQEESKRLFTRQLVLALPKILRDEYEDVNRPPGSSPFTAKSILASLRLKFDTAVNTNYESQRAAVKTHLLPGESVRDLVNVHRKAHRFFTQVNATVPEFVKVSDLMDCLSTTPSFRDVIMQYQIEFPDTFERQFDVLAKRVELTESIQSSSQIASTTARDQGYVAHMAVKDSSLITMSRDDLQSMIADGIAAAAKVTSRTTLNPNSAQLHSTRNKDFSTTYYCWSHGVCGHDSSRCRKKEPGHVLTAKLNNPCGGFKGLWSDLQKLDRASMPRYA